MRLKNINTYLLQTIFALLAATWFCFFIDKTWFLPAILGSSAGIIPALLFEKIFLSDVCSHKAAKARLKQFYLAEIIKIITIILFFVLSLWFFKVNPFVFFLGFVIVQILGWILNFLRLRKA